MEDLEAAMTSRDAEQAKRRYQQPRLTVHGTVDRITQLGAPPGHNERNPIYPGSRLRGPFHGKNH